MYENCGGRREKGNKERKKTHKKSLKWKDQFEKSKIILSAIVILFHKTKLPTTYKQVIFPLKK